MTRQHFEALAAALRETQASDDTIAAVADVCEATNPRFNRERFIKAATTKKVEGV